MSGWTSSDINAAGLMCMIAGNAATTGTGTPGPFYTASGTTSYVTDTVKAALFGVTPTTATAVGDTFAHNTYLATGGQWVTANECSGTGYTAGGNTVGTKTEAFTVAQPSVVTFSGASPATWTITGTITAYGALVYDTTTAGLYSYCWNWFGGVQTVTAGTFTVNWNASGIFAISVA